MQYFTKYSLGAFTSMIASLSCEVKSWCRTRVLGVDEKMSGVSFGISWYDMNSSSCQMVILVTLLCYQVTKENWVKL